MRENHNPKEMLLAIEQWHKIETMLNELPLTREQRRIVGDVKWHAAKYNSSYSRIRNEDEQLWKTERHFCESGVAPRGPSSVPQQLPCLHRT